MNRHDGPRFVMSLRSCQQQGTAWAAAGRSETEMLDSLERQGFSRTGHTARRHLRAYREQAARG